MTLHRATAKALVVSGVGIAVIFGGVSAFSVPTGAPAVRASQRTSQQAQGPTAVISDPGDAIVGTPLSLDAGGSSGDGLTYFWDFGDGTTGAGATVRHAYSRVDDFQVALQVRDRQGAVSDANRVVRALPAVQRLIGEPRLGQIVPASAFTAYLALSAPGINQLSVRIGGTYLFSDRWEYAGDNSASLLEVPDVRVVNEDDPDIAANLLRVPGASIPLANNVTVTISYLTTQGKTESPSYTTSLLRPDAAATPQNASSRVAGDSEAATPTPTPAPRSASIAYQQATATPSSSRPQQTPVPIVSSTASATPAALATPTPPPVATPVPTVVIPPPAVWAVTYPTYLPVVGRPANADDVNDYYLKGDRQFHNAGDPQVRRWAIKIARAGGIFPDDPQRAADNIYRYVYSLLGIGDPGELQSDRIMIDRIESGVLVPGARSGVYICIAHAYFLSSLTRTLGLPTREETVGFGRGVAQDTTGAWIMNYYQEGANEVWYNGDWHHYDTWIGTRDRADYLSTNLTEIAWYAYSEQSTPFTDIREQPVGLSGHDFALGKFSGTPGSPEQWRFLEQQTRSGIRVADPGPDAYASADRAMPAASEPTVAARIDNPFAPMPTREHP